MASQGYWPLEARVSRGILHTGIITPMRDMINSRLAEITSEIQTLHNERETMMKRDAEIEVRLHQLVGAVYEMQQLIARLDRQPESVELLDLGKDQTVSLASATNLPSYLD